MRVLSCTRPVATLVQGLKITGVRRSAACSHRRMATGTGNLSIHAQEQDGTGKTHGAARAPGELPVLHEDRVYKRYLSVFTRRVQHPETPSSAAVELDYDLVGHPQCDFQFAVTFPFHPALDHSLAGSQVTVLREYCQGMNRTMYNLPTGGFDPCRHADLQACAAAELSEEAHLRGGRWAQLMAQHSAGFTETKWCMNTWRPFLCIDPQADTAPGQRDAEEVSIEVLRMGVGELRQLMVSGEMLLHSVVTSFLALEHLREQGWLQESGP